MIGLVPRLNIRYNIFDAFVALKSIFVTSVPTEDNRFYLNHARTGLRVALSSLNLTKGSRVAVMVYNCYTVMKAVETAGFDIEYIDINDDFTIDFEDLKRKRTNFNAIIITHLFGIPNDIDAIKDICPDIPVIEDCAHGFLSSINNERVGNKGDMSVFSIGLGKFPSIGSGGYLVVNNQKYLDKIKYLVVQLKRPSLKNELTSVMKNLVMGILHNPVIYKYFSKPILKGKNNGVDDDLKYKNDEDLILRSSLGLFLSKQKNYIFWLYKQKEYAESTIESLNQNLKANVLTSQSGIYEPNRFMIPFLYNERDRLILYFQNNGIEVGSHFSKAIQWAGKFGYVTGYCPNAEKITAKIVVCPCHYNLKEKHIKLINQLIRNLK